jgi:hypothetical protein
MTIDLQLGLNVANLMATGGFFFGLRSYIGGEIRSAEERLWDKATRTFARKDEVNQLRVDVSTQKVRCDERHKE